MNRTVLDRVSLQTLAQQSPLHICWIVCSTLGTCSNLLVSVTIACTSTLRNKSQFVVLSHAISQVISMNVYTFTGLVRYLAYALNIPQTSEPLMCALKQTPLNLSTTATGIFAQALALDRFLCVVFPIYYKQLNTRNYVTLVNAVIWTYATIKAMVGFVYILSTSLIPVCQFSLIFNEKYTSVTSAISSTLLCLIAATYAITACVLFCRYKKTSFAGEIQKREWRRQNDFDVFVALTVMGALYLACNGTSIVLTAVSRNYVGNTQVTLLFTMLITLDSFVGSITHLPVYLKFNSRFRKGFLKMIRRMRNQAVAPTVTG